MHIDWNRAENAVFNAAAQCFDAFAELHRDEVFYGFFLDCDAYYFDILGHFNMPLLLHKRAIDYQTQEAELYPGWSIEKLEEKLRWSAGDWGHFEVFNPRDYDKEYNLLVTQAICYFHSSEHKNEAYVEPVVYTSFLEMACRVAVRLEAENCFSKFQRTPDFRVLCADHDERIEDGEKRLMSFRKAAKGT